jgi:dienelactone hydrolase
MERTEVTFPSHGETIAAWFWNPGGEGRHPCVVLGHGFSATRRDGLEAFAERFAAAGLAALAFDYRFFGDSTGEPRQVLDIRRQLEDWEAALAYVRSRDDVDPDRVAVWGSSFGGAHAITTASRDHRLAAAISQAPFTDGLAQMRITPLRNGALLTVAAIRDYIAAWRGKPPVLIKPTGPPGSLAVMTSPDAQPGFAALIPPDSKWRDEVSARVMLQVGTYRPVRSARKVTCPLLVCVCDEDQVTPPGPAIKAALAAPKGELRRYPIGHFEIYGGQRGFEQAATDQTDFLVRHLLGGSAHDAVLQVRDAGRLDDADLLESQVADVGD